MSTMPHNAHGAPATTAARDPSRRRAPVRATVLPHAAHVSAWVRETARSRAVAQMFNDFDVTQEPSK